MNEIAIFLESLVILFFGIPLLIFGTYGTIILYYNKAKKNHSNRVSASTQYEPTVSLVIPTHNEVGLGTTWMILLVFFLVILNTIERMKHSLNQ